MSTDPNQLDPAVGSAANQEAGQARQDAQHSLSDGTIDLRGLFDQGATPGPVGHMHVRAALVSLPHIDETRADRILAATGIDGSHHVDQLGSDQQQQLIDAAAEYA